jgi:hypothetical protein
VRPNIRVDRVLAGVPFLCDLRHPRDFRVQPALNKIELLLEHSFSPPLHYAAPRFCAGQLKIARSYFGNIDPFGGF